MKTVILSVWTVYDHPRDCPNGFVARLHVAFSDGTTAPTKHACYAPTLEEVRALLPRGLACIARSPEDDPKIVETWI